MARALHQVHRARAGRWRLPCDPLGLLHRGHAAVGRARHDQQGHAQLGEAGRVAGRERRLDPLSNAVADGGWRRGEARGDPAEI